MTNNKINLRYATALFDFAVEKDQVEQSFNDVQLISKTYNDNREFQLLLKSPVIFPDKKIRILSALFKDRIGEVTWNFIEILTRKHREEYLGGIADAFIKLYNKSKNIKLARITTAVPLDELQKKKLIEILTSQTKSNIILEEKIEKSIIGGLIVKIEGFEFDDSIRSKIMALKQEFSVNTYIKGF